LPWDHQPLLQGTAINKFSSKSRRPSILYFLYATPRYATQCEILAKQFLVDSALCHIARSHIYLQISLRICNCMQKWVNSLISDPSGLIYEKTKGRKSRETVPFSKYHPHKTYLR
jgi:hypothetical protein